MTRQEEYEGAQEPVVKGQRINRKLGTKQMKAQSHKNNHQKPNIFVTFLVQENNVRCSNDMS